MNKNLLIAGGLFLIGGGLAYYLIQQYGWPNGITCWKCEGKIPVSKTFPKGTICGLGAAIEYPFYTKPINCDGNGPNTHRPYGTSVKMVYSTIVGTLPGVLIAATNDETGITYSDISDDAGVWSLEVPLGVYTVVASKAGHETLTRPLTKWDFPGEWDYGPFYGYLEYLFNYNFYYDGPTIWHKVFEISDFDEWDAAGQVRLSGTVDLLPCMTGTIDIRKYTEYGSGEIFKEFFYQKSHFDISKTWSQPVEDRITAISVWACCGFWPSTTPALQQINLNFQRLW